MRLEIGTLVNTPDGPGKIVKIDLPESRAWRYVVELEHNPFSAIPFPCYDQKEIEASRK